MIKEIVLSLTILVGSGYCYYYYKKKQRQKQAQTLIKQMLLDVLKQKKLKDVTD